MATEHVLVPRQKYEQLTSTANSITDKDTSKIGQHQNIEKDDNNGIIQDDDDVTIDDYPSATDSDDSDAYNISNAGSDVSGTPDAPQQHSHDKKKKKNKKKEEELKKNKTVYASTSFHKKKKKKRTRDDIIPRPPGIMKKDIDFAISKTLNNNITKSKPKKNNVKRWIRW